MPIELPQDFAIRFRATRIFGKRVELVQDRDRAVRQAERERIVALVGAYQNEAGETVEQALRELGEIDAAIGAFTRSDD